MPVQQTKLNLGQSLELNLVAMPEKLNQVYLRWDAQGYNILNQLTDKMNVEGSVSVANPKFEYASLGGVSVFSQVNGAATINPSGNLVVPVNSTDTFRPDDVVQDLLSYAQGTVISVNPAIKTIELKAVNVSWNTGLHFINGVTAAKIGDSSIAKGSTGRVSLYNIPEFEFNYTQIRRESADMFRRDNIKTWVSYYGDFWSAYQAQEALVRLRRSKELSLFWGDRAIVDAGGPNERTFTGGIRWNIINRNPSLYFPITNQLDTATLNDIISTYIKRTGANIKNVIALMGADAIANLNENVTQPYIQYAGNQNTFGGLSVEGISVMEYSFSGLKLQYAHYKPFDAPEFQSQISSITGRGRASSSILLMSLEPIMSPEGQSLAPIRPHHFGANEYLAGYLTGMYDSDLQLRGALEGQMAQLSNQPNLVTDVDKTSFHVYTDCGWWIDPQNMALIELAY